MRITELVSSSISDLIIEEDYIGIIFNSSTNEYKYKVNNDKFLEQLYETLKIKESLGRYINRSIKKEWIVVLNNEES